MNKIERIKNLVAQIRQESGVSNDKPLIINSWKLDDLGIGFHKVDYQEATEIRRNLEVGEVYKSNCGQFMALNGKFPGGNLSFYLTDTPPTCRKEKYTERIPKTSVVETGEFIEVERERIVCGE